MFWPLQLNFEVLGVPMDSQVPISGMWLSSSHSFQSGVAIKFLDIYKLELRENVRVHPTFHVSLLKSVTYDVSRFNQEHNSRPPLDLVHDELEFEVKAMFKSRQLRGREWEYLVKWKGYHPIEVSWVNESDMEHAQEAIEEFHNRATEKQKRHRTWWRHHLSFSGVGTHTNVPHQVVSEIKV